MRFASSLLAAFVAATAIPVQAALTKLEIASQRPFGSFRAGDYVLMEGRVHGEIAPSEQIPGLDKATRNSRGKVEYSARIVLVIPAMPAHGNGTLIVDIPNRGNAYAETLYNSPRDDPFSSGTFEQGTGFLQDHGFLLAEVYWELGQGAELPSFTEDGKKLYVEGVGFAIVRDTTDFLRSETSEANPLRGAVKRVIGSGKSQSGRFLKTFLYNGFNKLADRTIFDGLHVITSAGMLPLMRTSPGPQSSANGIPTFEDPEWRGYTEEPLLVSKVGAGGPKMFVQNSTTDYYSIRSSLQRTGASGTTDVALPANMRMYDMAGAPHVIGSKAKCETHPAILDWTPVSRALLLHLDAWISRGIEPPATTLMALETATPGSALQAPRHFPDAVIQVPKRDADGNTLGGIRLPDVEAPLGVHLGLNATHTRGCMLVGGYVPFDAAQIAARYRNRDDYVNRIRVASRRLIDEGFLLPGDAAIIIEEAASSRAFAKAK